MIWEARGAGQRPGGGHGGVTSGYLREVSDLDAHERSRAGPGEVARLGHAIYGPQDQKCVNKK